MSRNTPFSICHLAAVVAVGLLASPALAGPKDQTGNGAPSGPHYNLNIIGHESQCPGDDLKGSKRHTIHVLLTTPKSAKTGDDFATLDKRNKIFLFEGEFQVLDGNACDGDGGAFQLLANPICDGGNCPAGAFDDPNFQEYEVFARPLGGPGGKAVITTCANDSGTVVCSLENTMDVLKRDRGKEYFEKVTKELTTICLDTTGNGICDTRVELFSAEFVNYFWDYDNDGLRLAQLRFYPIPD
jgi:hypothetical protein